MKFILCQPAIHRFEWELEVCLTNLKEVGFDLSDVILLFTKHDDSVPAKLSGKYGVEVHTYSDERSNKSYMPSVKPYLWWKFLAEDKSRENETYFYFDSDVIFRGKPDLRRLKCRSDKWLCSDCNGYLNLDYIKSCKNGEKIISQMCKIIRVTRKSIETINYNSGGAQWVIKNPSAAYWEKVYNDSTKIYNYFQSIDSDIQKWTAEMWAQLWNMMYFNVGPQISKELDFCWPTDDISEWNKNKIMHNAGVTENMKNLFFKGKYVKSYPFGEDFSFVDKSKASAKYVEAIKKVRC
ncbi:hypothetical protein [Liquorilactobacillus nagelii]|uniref:hypothetical protein n=1 Tax=Liquorilactobacillus nagelii TaxID=82688 RepID=UPI0039E9B0B0